MERLTSSAKTARRLRTDFLYKKKSSSSLFFQRRRGIKATMAELTVTVVGAVVVVAVCSRVMCVHRGVLFDRAEVHAPHERALEEQEDGDERDGAEDR